MSSSSSHCACTLCSLTEKLISTIELRRRSAIHSTEKCGYLLAKLPKLFGDRYALFRPNINIFRPGGKPFLGTFKILRAISRFAKPVLVPLVATHIGRTSESNGNLREKPQGGENAPRRQGLARR